MPQMVQFEGRLHQFPDDATQTEIADALGSLPPTTTFDFTSPEGKTYSINGPKGASKEQAFQVLQQHLQSLPDDQLRALHQQHQQSDIRSLSDEDLKNNYFARFHQGPAQATTLSAIRQQFPQYSDLSDSDLADALHKKFYADMPSDEFNAKIGFQPPNVGGDIGKSAIGGLVRGAVGLPAAIPSLLGLTAAPAQALAEHFGVSDPEAERQRTELRDLVAGNNSDFLNRNLPQPQTTAGKYAQTAAEFVPASLGAAGSIGRNLIGGIVGGLGSEAAGQAAQGTGAETAARILGGLFGGAAGTRAANVGTAAEKIAPADVLAAGSRGFKEARGSKVAVDPNDVLNLVDRTRTKLANEGAPPSLAGGANATIDELEASANRAIDAGQPMSANDLVAYRQTMTNHTKFPSPNSAAAGMAKSVYDAWEKDTLPTLADVHQAAIANFREGSLGQAIANKADRATYGAAAANSGMNIENKLRQSLVSIVFDPRKLGRYSDETQQLMKEVVNGTKPLNALRAVGNLLGGGGGLAAASYGLAGAIPSLITGNPLHLLTAALPVAGNITKRIGNRATMRKMDEIAQQALAQSPYVQQRMAGAPVAVQPGLIGGLVRNNLRLLPAITSANQPQLSP
jgi:hypothetical protein